MVRPRLPADERRRKLGIRLDPELYEWVERKIQEKEFASFTHAIELALQKLKHERRD